MRRVAVFVDGDTVGTTLAGMVLAGATRYGRTDLVRVYAGGRRHADWLKAPGFRAIHSGTGRNASHILLTVDAMEIALIQGFDAFVLAGSQGDLSHLALRLREHGLHVVGMGDFAAPARFRAACSEFLGLAARPAEPPGQDSATVTSLPARSSVFDRRVQAMIAAHSHEGRGMPVADLPSRMRRAHGTRISEHPRGRWYAYLQARPDLYDLDPRGKGATVRLRQDASDRSG